jgi:hypothetical protein
LTAGEVYPVSGTSKSGSALAAVFAVKCVFNDVAFPQKWGRRIYPFESNPGKLSRTPLFLRFESSTPISSNMERPR